MPIRQLLIVLSLGALAGLTACGGDGDGGGTRHPQFPTTPAALTSANALSFARLADLATRAGVTMRLGEPLNGLASPFTDLGCGVLGSTPATVAVNAASGPVNGTVTYTAFDRCFGIRVNGSASLTGTLTVGPLVNAMEFRFGSLAFTAGTETIQANGRAELDWTSTPPDSIYVMILNATAAGASSFELAAFRIDSQVVAGREEVAISGRLTTSDGFVDIATGATRPQLVFASSGLQGGPITMTGATSVATVTFNGASPPTIIITP